MSSNKYRPPAAYLREVLISSSMQKYVLPTFVAISFSVLFFFPLYPNNLQMNTSNVDVTLLIASVAALSTCAPLIIDLVLDLLSSISSELITSRLCIVLTLMIVCIAILVAYQSHSFNSDVLESFLHWQIFADTAIFLVTLHTLIPTLWNQTKCYVLFSTFLALMLLNLLQHTVIGASLDLYPLVMAEIVLIALFYSIFLANSLYSFKTLLFPASTKDKDNKYHMSTKHLTIEETMAMGFISIFSCASLAYLVLYLIGSQCTRIHTAVTLYIHAVIAVMTCILPGRLLKAKAFQLHYDLSIKRSFVKFISHEIRTPMNIIFMGLELVENQLREGDFEIVATTRTVADLKESCSDAIDILNDLLTYEKLDSHAMILNFNSENIISFLEEILKPCRIAARSRGIRFQLLPMHATQASHLRNVRVDIDKGKMGQVVHNLVSNAIEFTKRGGNVTVDIEVVIPMKDKARSFFSFRNTRAVTPVESTTEPWIRVKIIDTGVGLSSEQTRTLFNDNNQFQLKGHEDDQRAGLGLWISKRIIELHGGKIGVQSKGIGHGSMFYVDLPCKHKGPGIEMTSFMEDLAMDGDDKDADPLGGMRGRNLTRLVGMMGTSLKKSFKASFRASFRKSFFGTPKHEVARQPSSRTAVNFVNARRMQSAESIHPAPSGATETMTILVVDDSSLNRKIIVKTLVHMKNTCVEAEDGNYAVDMVVESLKAGPVFDVILMDNFMPRMNGTVAAKKMREAGYKGIIIGVTGNALDMDVDEYVRHGADAVLLKPMSAEKFLTLLAEIRAKRQFLEEAGTLVATNSSKGRVGDFIRNLF